MGPLTIHSRHSVRSRLLMLALLPLGIALPLILLALTYWGGDYVDRLLETKVASDLAVARGYYARVSHTLGHRLHAFAASVQLARALHPGTPPNELNTLLKIARQEQSLDFLRFHARADSQSHAVQRPVIADALAGQTTTANEIFSADELAAISTDLATRARIPLLTTANARPDPRQLETRGLVIHAAAPVHNLHGELIGVLEGGVLLNKNLAFIDELNQLVFPAGTLPEHSVGTATLFLDDVRIATNVRLFEDTRAIGTRVSSAVHDAVLQRGETWLSRAFVVNDWYVSGYEPLSNRQGQRIGMLYVGFLESPFLHLRQQTLGSIALLFAVVMVIAGLGSAFWARRIFTPIERMYGVMHDIQTGNPLARVGHVAGHDELSQLAVHFDDLLDRLQRQADSLKRWGTSLDAKVAERTAELEQALSALRTAQTQLINNEKLAAIGQLTAGLAHEINNPVAVIQGNLDVLRDLLGADAQPVEPEIKLIHEQVNRIRLLVAKLLQFARPQDYAGYLELTDAAALIQDSLVLVQHLLRRGNIAIEQRQEAQRQILCHRHEIQQVLINLLVNGIEAMPTGGMLTITTADWDEADMPIGIAITIRDTGTGIATEDLDRIFEPFFTTKKTNGNGLGLWISKMMVERYGGQLTATPGSEGQGSAFTIRLRCEPLE